MLGYYHENQEKVGNKLLLRFDKDDYSIVGGHLVSAVISATGEIWIEVLEEGFEREFNEEFGANLWAD